MFLLRMLMKKGRGGAMDPLHVSMTGVRMGESFLLVGCDDKALLAGLAAKVGLSGTAAVAAFNDEQAKRAQGIGAKVGALIDVQKVHDRPDWEEFTADQFDMVVIDDTADGFAGLGETARRSSLRNALRVVRPGGRIEVIARVQSEAAAYDPLNELSAAGFKPVRLLADRDRFRFIEGLRPSGSR